MEFLETMRWLIIPLMSAVIGVFTNYIAVKMLFRPYRAKYIGKLRIPFTPGIMPRRQSALAKGLGQMVSNSLVREEDLKHALSSEEMSHTVARAILAFPSIRVSAETCFEDGYEAKRDKVLDFLADRILAAIVAMNVGDVIAAEAKNAVSGFTARNPLLSMFVNDAMIAGLTAPIGEKVTAFLEGNGKEKLRAALAEEVEKIDDKPIAELLRDKDEAERVLVGLYRRLVDKYAGAIAAQFHIAEIVEKKINAMPPQDLEALVLSVMKKELNAVIWLGGVIGLILGLVSLFINRGF